MANEDIKAVLDELLHNGKIFFILPGNVAYLIRSKPKFGFELSWWSPSGISEPETLSIDEVLNFIRKNLKYHIL